jgi:microcompartment protein CcmL/EutN
MDTDQVTQPTPSTDAGAQAANTIMELESMIKNSVSTIERNKEELKKLREMVDSALTNDEGYREAAEKAKEAVKAKSKAKVNVMQNQATKNLAAKA